jgi:predicted nucleic acid-binding protein
MIVLDTNVLSEVMKPAPSKAVVKWLSEQVREKVYTTTITEAEILYGIALLPNSARKKRLENAVLQMFSEDLTGKLIPFDSYAAKSYALIGSIRKNMGKPISFADAQIASIALSRGAKLATRNVKDFEGCGVDLVNPFE